jgi:tetratricopeptide (TPR) repeat protein
MNSNVFVRGQRSSRLWVCLGLLCFSAVAGAATKNEKKAAVLVKDAGKLYDEGKYREAAEVLKAAHDLDPNTKLLYNIARAYDQAGDLPLSLDYYRQYVAATEDLDPALVKKANLAMDRLRALLAKEDAAKQVADADRKRLEEDKRRAEEKGKAEAAAAQKQREEYEARQAAEAKASAEGQGGRRIISYAAGGLAVVGLGTGIIFGLGAQGSKAAFTTAPDLAAKRQFEAETKSKALLADVGFGVAIAAAVAVVVAWPKGPAAAAPEQEQEQEQEQEKEEEVTLRVVPVPGGAGLAVTF